MGKDEPTGVCFDRRTAIAHLDVFPRVGGLDDQFAGVPEIQHVGVHQGQMFPILPAQHRVVTIDFSREQCHAFVGDGRSVERMHFETQEVLRF